MDKSGYVRIKPDYLLRGWQGLPYALVKRGSGRPYFMNKDVYRTMHESLKAGDCTELCEYWRYYLEREGGVFGVEHVPNGVRLVVKECPAQKRLVELGEKPDPVMCKATEIFNAALAEGSTYDASLVRTGEFSCVQEFRRRGAE